MNSKTIFQVLAVSLCMLACWVVALDDPTKASSIYDFTVKDTYGNEVCLEKFRGNVVLIVNIASTCAFTLYQYESLKKLHDKYHDKGLRILAFPTNDFAEMPQSDGHPMITHLALHNVTFDLVMAKGHVNGLATAPLYQYLKHKQRGILRSAVKWNFEKFLVDKHGQPVKRYIPFRGSNTIGRDIEQLLE